MWCRRFAHRRAPNRCQSRHGSYDARLLEKPQIFHAYRAQRLLHHCHHGRYLWLYSWFICWLSNAASKWLSRSKSLLCWMQVNEKLCQALLWAIVPLTVVALSVRSTLLLTGHHTLRPTAEFSQHQQHLRLCGVRSARARLHAGTTFPWSDESSSIGQTVQADGLCRWPWTRWYERTTTTRSELKLMSLTSPCWYCRSGGHQLDEGQKRRLGCTAGGRSVERPG